MCGPPLEARVLLVDDDPLVLDVLREILERGGHRVYAAGSPLRALELATQESFDLVVTDVHMEEMNGPDLVDELRRRGSSVPALYLTGFIDDDALGERAQPRLEKPFNGRALIEAVTARARTRGPR